MEFQTRLTVIVPYKIFPARMGGQKGIALFYDYLSRQIPVTIISTKNNEVPRNPAMQLLPLLNNSRFRYLNSFLYFKLKKILRANHSKYLVIEHPYYGWLGILLKTFINIRMVVHSHNIESVRFRSMGKWWWPVMWQYEKMVHQQADVNFFVTDEDREFAKLHFKLDPAKCHTTTYGFEISEPPTPSEKQEAKKQLQKIHGIKDSEKILLFNGTLDYQPNQDALDVILNKINPLLLSKAESGYKIIICGKALPPEYESLKQFVGKNIIYAGFVDDINVYFKGSDIFINPVTDGGGIKTKLVEALGFDLSVVSTRSGAAGIPPSVTGHKLQIIDDNDWESFSNAINRAESPQQIPQAYFDHFYWGNIATRVALILNK